MTSPTPSDDREALANMLWRERYGHGYEQAEPSRQDYAYAAAIIAAGWKPPGAAAEGAPVPTIGQEHAAWEELANARERDLAAAKADLARANQMHEAAVASMELARTQRDGWHAFYLAAIKERDAARAALGEKA